MKQKNLTVAVNVLDKVRALSEVLLDIGEISETPPDSCSLGMGPVGALGMLAESLLHFVDTETLREELAERPSTVPLVARARKRSDETSTA